MAQTLKPIITAVIMSSGSVLSVSWYEATALAQEVPLCFMLKPTTELVNLTEMCSRRKEQPLLLSVEQQVEYLYSQANILSQQGRFQEALAQMTQVLNIEPKSPNVHVNRGNLRLEAGDVEGAVADFQRAVELFNASNNSENASIIQQRISEIQKNL